MSAITTLRKQIAEAQAKLEEATSKFQTERAQLVRRLAEIDAELGGEVKPVKPRAKGIGQQVVGFITDHPGSTIRQVQAGLPDLPPSSVETNIRAMAGKGTLVKDDSNPRKFSVPAPQAPEKAPTPKSAVNSGNGRALQAT